MLALGVYLGVAFDLGLSVTVPEECCAAKEVETESGSIGADLVHKTFIYWLAAAFCKITDVDSWINKQ